MLVGGNTGLDAGGGLLLAVVHSPKLHPALDNPKNTDGSHMMDKLTCRVLPAIIGCGFARLREARHGVVH